MVTGKGLTPYGHDPAADLLPKAGTLARLANIRRVGGEVAGAMHPQEEPLRRINRALAPERLMS